MSRRLYMRLPSALLLILLVAGSVTAQIDEDKAQSVADPVANPAAERPAETVPVIREYVVVGTRPDEKSKAEQLYAEMLRRQMYEEVERLRKEEEIAWRNSNLMLKPNEKSRISFGYDPVADRNLREQTDINEMPGETVKPATLFRTKF